MKRFFGIFGWLLDSLDSSWQLWLALGSSTIFGKGSLFVCFLLLLCFYFVPCLFASVVGLVLFSVSCVLFRSSCVSFGPTSL